MVSGHQHLAWPLAPWLLLVRELTTAAASRVLSSSDHWWPRHHGVMRGQGASG